MACSKEIYIVDIVCDTDDLCSEMKIVIGHKVLNLEEITNVANLGVDLAEVIVDSQLYAELATQAPPKTIDAPQFNSIMNEGAKQMLTKAQFRAAILVKLVQLLKLKKNAQKSTIDFFVGQLNAPAGADDQQVSGGSDLANMSL